MHDRQTLSCGKAEMYNKDLYTLVCSTLFKTLVNDIHNILNSTAKAERK